MFLSLGLDQPKGHYCTLRISTQQLFFLQGEYISDENITDTQ